MAQEGGLGVIHKSMSIGQQAREVRSVKKFESGVVRDPFTIPLAATVRDLISHMQENSISGLPVTDNTGLVGIVTSRDVRFEANLDASVETIMTPKSELVTVKEDFELSEVKELLHRHRIEKILVVNDNFELRGLITLKDIRKSEDYPNASKDELGRLRAAAAVGPSNDAEERVSAIVDAGVDVLVVDTAHGHTRKVGEIIKYIKKTKNKKTALCAGNIATPDAAKFLIKLGVDIIKVGIGPGSICTTRLVAGIGVPQLSAILSVRNGVKNKKIKIISDGGIKYSGDLAKAFAAGADAVMIGSLFAGTDETPGKLIKKNGKIFKSFRGMGSVGAMNKGSADRYFQKKQKDVSKYVPEGVEGFVKYKGDVGSIIYKLVGGLKSSMGYLGSKNIVGLRNKPHFVKITKAGFYESMVHNVDVIKSDSKY